MCSPSPARFFRDDTNKNDPDDARSVAVAALRSAGCRQVRADDHAAVPKVWPTRHRDLGRARTQAVCRLHAVMCELVPGGVSKAIIAAHAAQLLESITPSGAIDAARCELAAELLEDLRHIDSQLRETRKKLTAAVQASGTSLTGLFGVGPVIAATVIGGARDPSRFPDGDHFAAYNGTAPIEVSSGKRQVYRLSRRGNRRLNHAIHMAAVTQVRQRHSRAMPASRRNWARERPVKKRSARSSGASAMPSSLASKLTASRLQPAQRAREGSGGTTLSPARPAHTPGTASRPDRRSRCWWRMERASRRSPMTRRTC
jgi:transposase